MKKSIAVLLLCLLPVAVVADDSSNSQENENQIIIETFMRAVRTMSPVIHDTLNDAATAYKHKCGTSADIPTLKAIASSSPDFSKMLAIKSLFENSDRRATTPLTPTALREYEEAAKSIPCMIGVKPN